MSTALSARKLRKNSPAPVESTNDSAISATTSELRSRFEPQRNTPRDENSTREACTAGRTPNTIADNREMPIANASTALSRWISFARGRLAGERRSSA